MIEQTAVADRVDLQVSRDWPGLIRAAWQKGVQSIFEVAQLLKQAKQELASENFTQMCERELPFSPRTAYMLVSIGNDGRILKHVSKMPPSWGTLHLISRLPDATFNEAIEQNVIRPDTERKEIERLLKDGKRQQRIDDVKAQAEALRVAVPGAPNGLFHVVSIDPPWPYDDGADESTYDPNGRRAANPYPEMSLEEIAALQIPAADDCVLWLWTTHKFMRHSFALLDGWGFEDKAILTWAKDRMGLGRWLRSQSEFCIMAVRGNPVITLANQTTVLHGPLREHSRKPDEFYALVDSLCVGRKLDFFSREPREGWEQFGNDCGKFQS